MEKSDFKSWKEAVEFYKEEYKDIILQEFLFRMEMKWENREYQIRDTKTRHTPLWAYDIKKTFVNPHPL